MQIQLIQGEFNSKDTLSIITQMIQIKIKYHEGKINQNHHEEEIKHRESKIKKLQNYLNELRNFIEEADGKIIIQSEINISK